MASVIIVLHNLIRIFIFALLIRAVISWVAPMSRHPLVVALIRVTDPFLEPIRNVVGTQNGIDASPLILMVILYLIDALLIGLLR